MACSSEGDYMSGIALTSVHILTDNNQVRAQRLNRELNTPTMPEEARCSVSFTHQTPVPVGKLLDIAALLETVNDTQIPRIHII